MNSANHFVPVSFLFRPYNQNLSYNDRQYSEALAEYAVELNKTLNDLEGDIRRLADEPSLNVNSARQLGEVLFGKLRIAEKPKMTKTKQFSTEEEYLQTFAHKYEIV